MSKDDYFKRKDAFIDKLAEPERSVYKRFREIEKNHMKTHGKLVIDGKTPLQLTAEEFQLPEETVKQYCKYAAFELKKWVR